MLRRNNAFTKKPHKLQLLSYFIIILQLVVYWLLILWSLPNLLQIIFSVLFTSEVIAVIVSWFLTAYSDPTDDISLSEQRARAMNEPFDPSDLEYFCDICETHVTEDSKHCKQCSRCVSQFDHHCKWINNCIGGKNYRPFIVMIFSVMLLEGTFLTSAILVSIWTPMDHDTIVSLTVIYITSAISVITFILDFNLVLFHIWLMHHRMTTYQYILNLREKRTRSRIMPDLEHDGERKGVSNMREQEKDNDVTEREVLGPQITEKELITPPPEQKILQHQITSNTLERSGSPAQVRLKGEETPVLPHRPLRKGNLEPIKGYKLNKMTEFVVQKELLCEQVSNDPSLHPKRGLIVPSSPEERVNPSCKSTLSPSPVHKTFDNDPPERTSREQKRYFETDFK